MRGHRLFGWHVRKISRFDGLFVGECGECSI